MSKRNSEQTTLFKRSIFWLMILLAIVGITYSYEKSLFTDGWQALTTSATTEELPICCVETDKPQVSLSFDTTLENENTKKILDTLKEYDIHATFFITGEWIDKYPEDVKAIYEAGHDLGNSGNSYYHMPEFSTDKMDKEINKVTEKVKKLTGITMNLFRPPYGDYDNNLIIQSKSLGYYPILWNIDSLDWKNYGTDSIVETVVNNSDLKNGSIILMHTGAKYTTKALPKVIEGLKEKGYEIIPVSQLIYKDNYHITLDGIQVSDKLGTAQSKY